jgi:hypothetical protein
VFIEELEENKAMDQHFVEAQIVQTNVVEENVVEAEVQAYKEVQVEVQ